ncbi:hypothetical protein PINS_up006248 [Pythium insidiosum]|nr:hypothetical protein PINS_up006248 [Pythium insidiosum]
METTPLVPPATRQRDPELELGTARFPFHPDAPSTPWWRRLCFELFRDSGDPSAIQRRDLWPLPRRLQSAIAMEELRASLRATDQRLFRAIWRMDRAALLRSAVLQLAAVVLDVLYPLLLFRLLSTVVTERGFALAAVVSQLAVIFVSQLLSSFLARHAHFQASKAAIRVAGGLRGLIIDECLRHGARRRQDQGTGSASGADITDAALPQRRHQRQRVAEIATIYNDDVGSIVWLLLSTNRTWCSVVGLVADVVILVHVVEIPWRMLLLDVLLFWGIWSLQLCVGARVNNAWRVKLERRLTTVHECFSGIQMIKFSAAEDKMMDKIARDRDDEMSQGRVASVLNAVRTVFGAEVINLAAAVTFAWLVRTGQPLTPSRVFTALILFRQIGSKARLTILLFDMIMLASKAAQKVEQHLRSCSSEAVASPAALDGLHQEQQFAVDLQNVWLSCSGLPHATDVLVANANLTVRRGELVVIHGLAGVGKSLLLSAIRGDIDVLQGRVHVDASLRVAYCSQEPWLQTMSIRDNVLFGSAFDEHKYWCVMDACGLLEDLEQLPMGDATQVGPKGINLSGGQKARIALARACYADADLYLLDCPLASVDAVVQSDVFRKCVVELLVHKTIVMVTHNPEIMGSSFVDQVVELRGTQLRSSSTEIGGSLRASSKEWQSRRRAGLGGMPPWRRTSSGPSSHSSASSTGLSLSPFPKHSIPSVRQVQVKPSFTSNRDSSSIKVSKETLRAVYSHRDSRSFLLVSLFILLLWAMTLAAKDVWIVLWCGGELTNHASAWYLDPSVVYALLILGGLILGIGASVAHLFVYQRAMERLFREMAVALLHTSMSFFYVTPIGDILRAFFGDTSVMDREIHHFSLVLLMSSIPYISSVLVLAYFSGLLGVLMLSVSYVAVGRVMALRTSLRLYQIGSAVEDENLSFISEALDGESVIRAFGPAHVARVVEAHHQTIDVVQRQTAVAGANYNRVLLRASMVNGVSMLLLVGLLGYYDMPPAELGLVLYYIFVVQDELMAIRMGVLTTMAALHCAERIRQFGQVRPEQELHRVVPMWSAARWPSSGRVVFESVSFGYADPQECVKTIAQPTTPLALRDVSFSVRSGERVGVVGRTGSGKSSLAMALFRMHPLVSGRILVDGVDISRLSLKTVRSSITIIPQSPLFYRCSVRDYLDPFGEYDDGRLWREVKRVGLGGHVRSLSDELWDNGENWSLGERQMLCFARALLRPSRVLVLDEAFSSVDQGREESLLGLLEDSVQPQQQYQQSAYGNRDDGGGRCERGVASSTVFLITHRVDQILGFDRILVMANGSVVEQGSATSLASDPSSLFYDFLETSLLTM